MGLGLQEHSSFPSPDSSHPTPSCPLWKVRSCGLGGQGPALGRGRAQEVGLGAGHSATILKRAEGVGVGDWGNREQGPGREAVESGGLRGSVAVLGA